MLPFPKPSVRHLTQQVAMLRRVWRLRRDGLSASAIYDPHMILERRDSGGGGGGSGRIDGAALLIR